MTTAASPSLGGTERLNVWWVEMPAGAAGPDHVVDSEQVWSLVQGRARVTNDDATADLEPGDTAVLPAATARQVFALTDLHAVVVGFGTATVAVPGETSSRGTPPWVSLLVRDAQTREGVLLWSQRGP